MTKVWRLLFWLVVAASLLMNAVVLGLYLRFGNLRGDSGFGGLPDGMRDELRAALRDHRRDLIRPLAELKSARRAMVEAVAARPFDRATVEAAMTRVREASLSLQQSAQTIMLDAVAEAAAKE
jgi:uncharacterized membrane protein